MFRTWPISASIFSTASLAPPCAGPHRLAMPAAMQANGLAPVEPGQAHRAGGGVLLMIRVQDHDQVHRARQHRIGLPGLGRHRVEHVQEVLRVAEVVARIHERLAAGVFVRPGSDRRHLGDQPERADPPALRIVDVQAVVVERRQRADHAAHHRHRVRVAAEAVEEAADLLMQHGVPQHAGLEFLRLAWRSAVRRSAAGSRLRGNASSPPAARSGSRGTCSTPASPSI